MKALRFNTLRLEILRMIFYVNTAYEEDISRYILTKTNNDTNAVGETINGLLKDGLIEYQAYTGIKKKIITITQRGRTTLLDKLDDEDMYALYDNNEYSFGTPFKSTQVDRVVIPALTTSRMTLLFESVGVPSLVDDKPRLDELVSILRESQSSSPHSNHYANESDRTYTINYLNADEVLDQFKETGYFYTAQEYKSMVNERDISSKPSDEYASSRMKGIYINNRTCLIIYDTSAKNRRIKYITLIERRLLQSVYETFNEITEIYRGLPLPNNPSGMPYALVITTGTKTIVEMTTGFKDGNRLERLKTQKEFASKKDSSTEDKKKVSLDAQLGNDSDLFRRVFAVPLTFNGMKSLRYLTSHDVESYMNDTRALIGRNLSEYSPYSTNSLYMFAKNYNTVAEHSFTPVVHIPVYEIKLIASLKSDETIITYPDMVKTIAHGSLNTHEYINGETMEPFDRHYTYDYCSVGIPVGAYKIIQELSARDYDYTKVFPKSIRTSFAEKMGYENPCEFYNLVGEGKLPVEDVVDVLTAGIEPTGKHERKPFRRKKRVNVTLSVTSEFAEKLITACELKSVSRSRYIEDSLSNQVEADADLYKSLVKQYGPTRVKEMQKELLRNHRESEKNE